MQDVRPAAGQRPAVVEPHPAMPVLDAIGSVSGRRARSSPTRSPADQPVVSDQSSDNGRRSGRVEDGPWTAHQGPRVARSLAAARDLQTRSSGSTAAQEAVPRRTPPLTSRWNSCSRRSASPFGPSRPRPVATLVLHERYNGRRTVRRAALVAQPLVQRRVGRLPAKSRFAYVEQPPLPRAPRRPTATSAQHPPTRSPGLVGLPVGDPKQAQRLLQSGWLDRISTTPSRRMAWPARGRSSRLASPRSDPDDGRAWVERSVGSGPTQISVTSRINRMNSGRQGQRPRTGHRGLQEAALGYPRRRCPRYTAWPCTPWPRRVLRQRCTGSSFRHLPTARMLTLERAESLERH